ncbi:hypothetical protein APHAL10511_000741 [Amanita phalloides]|nr:hypothetical protein APHAL10511_000741 [Amanita phalloides]
MRRPLNSLQFAFLPSTRRAYCNIFLLNHPPHHAPLFYPSPVSYPDRCSYFKALLSSRIINSTQSSLHSFSRAPKHHPPTPTVSQPQESTIAGFVLLEVMYYTYSFTAQLLITHLCHQNHSTASPLSALAQMIVYVIKSNSSSTLIVFARI